MSLRQSRYVVRGASISTYGCVPLLAKRHAVGCGGSSGRSKRLWRPPSRGHSVAADRPSCRRLIRLFFAVCFRLPQFHEADCSGGPSDSCHDCRSTTRGTKGTVELSLVLAASTPHGRGRRCCRRRGCAVGLSRRRRAVGRPPTPARPAGVPPSPARVPRAPVVSSGQCAGPTLSAVPPAVVLVIAAAAVGVLRPQSLLRRQQGAASPPRLRRRRHGCRTAAATTVVCPLPARGQ